jgi:hypothetical protein
MKTATAVAELVQVAFANSGGVGDAEPVVLRGKVEYDDLPIRKNSGVRPDDLHGLAVDPGDQ